MECLLDEHNGTRRGVRWQNGKMAGAVCNVLDTWVIYRIYAALRGSKWLAQDSLILIKKLAFFLNSDPPIGALLSRSHVVLSLSN
jgi:hypothetical protein